MRTVIGTCSGFPDARRHAPADQIAAVAHRARLGVALVPAERLRALAVAFAQRLAAVRPVLVLIAVRIAPQAKLERVELERDRQLVHRGFERKERGGGARRAHVARGREIELGEPVRVFRIGRFVEQAGPAGLLPMEVLVLRGHGHRIVRDHVERSAGVRADRDALDHRRPVAQHVHLLDASARHAPNAAARAPPAPPAPPETAGAGPSRSRRP